MDKFNLVYFDIHQKNNTQVAMASMHANACFLSSSFLEKIRKAPKAAGNQMKAIKY